MEGKKGRKNKEEKGRSEKEKRKRTVETDRARKIARDRRIWKDGAWKKKRKKRSLKNITTERKE